LVDYGCPHMLRYIDPNACDHRLKRKWGVLRINRISTFSVYFYVMY